MSAFERAVGAMMDDIFSFEVVNIPPTDSDEQLSNLGIHSSITGDTIPMSSAIESLK